jgi:hypothetical protein
MPRPHPPEVRQRAIELARETLSRSLRSLLTSGSPNRVFGTGSRRTTSTVATERA